MSDNEAPDCGYTYPHASHVYRTEHGKAEVCDGWRIPPIEGVSVADRLAANA